MRKTLRFVIADFVVGGLIIPSFAYAQTDRVIFIDNANNATTLEECNAADRVNAENEKHFQEQMSECEAACHGCKRAGGPGSATACAPPEFGIYNIAHPVQCEPVMQTMCAFSTARSAARQQCVARVNLYRENERKRNEAVRKQKAQTTEQLHRQQAAAQQLKDEAREREEAAAHITRDSRDSVDDFLRKQDEARQRLLDEQQARRQQNEAKIREVSQAALEDRETESLNRPSISGTSDRSVPAGTGTRADTSPPGGSPAGLALPSFDSLLHGGNRAASDRPAEVARPSPGDSTPTFDNLLSRSKEYAPQAAELATPVAKAAADQWDPALGDAWSRGSEIQGNVQEVLDLVNFTRDARSGNISFDNVAYPAEAFATVAEKIAGTASNVGIGVTMFREQVNVIQSAPREAWNRFEMSIKAFDTMDVNLMERATDFREYGREVFSKALPYKLGEITSWWKE